MTIFCGDGVMHNLPWVQRPIADETEIEAGENDPFPAVLGI